jgi:hypothetical protein
MVLMLQWLANSRLCGGVTVFKGVHQLFHSGGRFSKVFKAIGLHNLADELYGIFKRITFRWVSDV